MIVFLVSSLTNVRWWAVVRIKNYGWNVAAKGHSSVVWPI